MNFEQQCAMDVPDLVRKLDFEDIVQEFSKNKARKKPIF